MVAAQAAPAQEGGEKKKRADYNVVVERNIFAPPRPPKKPEKGPEPKKPDKPTPAPPPPAWVITSIFFHENQSAWKLIVEKQGAGLKVLKAGDEFDGMKIVSVDEKTAVLEANGKAVEKKLGDALKAPEPVAPSPESKPEAKPEEKAVSPASDVLENLRKKHKKPPLPEPPPDNH